jgi:5-hydroxyisourate hydrolase
LGICARLALLGCTSIIQDNQIVFQEKHERAFGSQGFPDTQHCCIQDRTAQGENTMPGYLTTHVLDTARGCPAQGLKIELFRVTGETRAHLKTLVTNADGRTDEQILPSADFETGTYELLFHAGAYLDATGTPPESPRFLDVIPLRFGMSEDTHYHVPLLLSPFGYSTYRGS